MDAAASFAVKWIYMAKSVRELAFLREHFIAADWTRRFTELFDKHIDFDAGENLLYINAGCGDHCFALSDKFGEKTSIFATCEDDEILKIAQEKAAAIKSDVDFSRQNFEAESFDSVVADASFVRPSEFEEFAADAARAARSGAEVAFVLPSAGSFGEIFSLLWEVLFNEDLGEHGAAAEAMISELPTVSHIEEMAERIGLMNIRTQTSKEVFEYENGADFVSSPLASEFLLPAWLSGLDEEQSERVTNALANLIDEEDGTLSFRFSVKATILMGQKF